MPAEAADGSLELTFQILISSVSQASRSLAGPNSRYACRGKVSFYVHELKSIHGAGCHNVAVFAIERESGIIHRLSPTQFHRHFHGRFGTVHPHFLLRK